MKKIARFRYTYTKLILIFVVSILPLYFLASAFIVSNYTTAKKEIVTSRSLSMAYFSDSVFNSLENTQNQIFQLLSGSDVSFYVLLEETDEYAEKVTYAKRIQEQLFSIELSCEYASSVTMLTENGSVIGSTSLSIGTGSSENMERFLSPSNFYYNEKTDSLYMLSRYPAAVTEGLPSALIAVELDLPKIRNGILKQCAAEKSGRVLITDTAGIWSIAPDQTDYSAFLSGVTDSPTLHKVSLPGRDPWGICAVSGTLGLKLFLYYPEAILSNSWILLLLVLATAVLTFVIVRIDWIFIKKIVATPVNTLMTALENAEKQKYTEIPPSKEVSVDADFSYILTQFNALIARLEKNAAQIYEQKMRTQEAEFKHLQVQINPHFLYNCLFTISRLSKDGNSALAGTFSDYLGRYFSYITKTGVSLVPLKDELEHLSTYIEIMRVRFSNRIRVFVDNFVDDTDILIPKLLIQPLVENAFQHGLKDTLTDGEIYINLSMTENVLRITVEDNGGMCTQDAIDDLNRKLSEQTEDFGFTALSNVHNRLKLYFGEKSGLSFELNECDGLRAIILIFFPE